MFVVVFYGTGQNHEYRTIVWLYKNPVTQSEVNFGYYLHEGAA
jgi:hypothetical protein